MSDHFSGAENHKAEKHSAFHSKDQIMCIVIIKLIKLQFRAISIILMAFQSKRRMLLLHYQD